MKNDKNKEPLIKGGQGRTSRELEDMVIAIGWVFIFSTLIVGLFFVGIRILG